MNTMDDVYAIATPINPKCLPKIHAKNPVAMLEAVATGSIGSILCERKYTTWQILKWTMTTPDSNIAVGNSGAKRSASAKPQWFNAAIENHAATDVHRTNAVDENTILKNNRSSVVRSFFTIKEPNWGINVCSQAVPSD